MTPSRLVSVIVLVTLATWLAPVSAQAPATPGASTCVDVPEITAAHALETLRIALDVSDACEAERTQDPGAKAIAEAVRNRPAKEANPNETAAPVDVAGAQAVSGDALIRSFKAAKDALAQIAVVPDSEPQGFRDSAIRHAGQAIAALERGDGDDPSLSKAEWSLMTEDDDALRVRLSLPPGQRPAITAESFKSCVAGAPTDSTCRMNFDSSLKIGRIIRSVEFYPLSEILKPKLAQLALEYAAREVMWKEYFTKTRVQYPWEMVINSHATFTFTQKAPEPPKYQYIIFHPDVALEYVTDAPDGEQFKPGLMAEIFGFNRWGGFDPKTGEINTAYGASAIATWADRAGTADLRWGVMLHFKSRYSIAYTLGDGHHGVLISIALGEKLRAAEADATKLKDAFKSEDYDAICDTAGLGFLCGK